MRPRRLVLLALVLAATSCQTSTEPRPAELTVTATPSRTQFPAGEAIEVKVTVANASSDTVWVPGGFLASLEIRDAAGRIVAFGRFQLLTLAARPPRPLAPSESVVDRAPWAGELNVAPVQGTQAAPGTYRIRAAVPLLGRGGNAYAYSAPITVELTPP